MERARGELPRIRPTNRGRRVLGWGVLFAVAGVALALSAGARGDPPQRPFGWADPIRVDREYVRPVSLAADAEGNAWVSWTGSGPWIRLSKYDASGSRVVDVRRLNEPDLAAWDHAIGVDPATGGVFGFFLGTDWGGEGPTYCYCAKFGADGSKLFGDLLITPEKIWSGPASVAVDPQGAAHFVRAVPGRGVKYSKVLSDGTLAVGGRVISDPDSYSAGTPQIAVDPKGDLHVVYGEITETNEGLVRYLKLDPDGNWLVRDVVLAEDGALPRLTVDRGGDVHVIFTRWLSQSWPYEVGIYYCRTDNRGSIRIPPRRVSGEAFNGWGLQVLVDLADRPHVFWHRLARSSWLQGTPARFREAQIREVMLDSRGRRIGGERSIFSRAVDWADYSCAQADSRGDLFVLTPTAWIGEDPEGLVLLRTDAAESCREGSVGAGTGGAAQDVLFLNGSTGDRYREVRIPEGASILGSIGEASGGTGAARYFVHATLALPDESTVTVLPQGVGRSCFDLQIPPHGAAGPAAIWNAGAPSERAGTSRYFDGTPIPDPPPAPATFLNLPVGDPVSLPSGTVITFQGVIQDRRSRSRRPSSVTNAVIVRIL